MNTYAQRSGFVCLLLAAIATAPARADTTPDPLPFGRVVGAEGGTLVVSKSLAVTGIDAPVTVSVSGRGTPRFSINGGPFRSAAATVHANDTLRLRVRASGTAGGRVVAHLSAGGLGTKWTVQTDTGRWASAYYPCYRFDAMPPARVDFSALTHVVHWPVIPNADGTLDTSCFGNGFTAARSKAVIDAAHAAGTKVLLGVGGDAASGATAGFQGATKPAHRSAFVEALVNLVATRGYDGIDINWEVIREADHANFQGFVQQLRATMNDRDPKLLLTFVPAANGDDGVLPALTASVLEHLDQVNLQTYVMSGPYPGWVTWHNSPLHNGGQTFPCCGNALPSIDSIVDAWIAAGIPASKLAISSQFDAFVWKGGSGTSTGGVTQPLQEWGATAPDLVTVTYHEMLAQFPAEQGFVRHFDETAKVPWIGRDVATSSGDRFVSYDDPDAIREKAAFARERGLGGYFVFELFGDYDDAAKPALRHPLLGAVKQYVKKGYVETP